MADRQIIQRVDDLDGSEAKHRVPFVVNGRWLQLDLSDKNKAAFDKAIEKYVAAATVLGDADATPTGISVEEHVVQAPSLLGVVANAGTVTPIRSTRRAGSTAGRRDTRTTADREQTKAMKQWLASNGYADRVPARGKIPDWLQDRYNTRTPAESVQEASNGG